MKSDNIFVFHMVIQKAVAHYLAGKFDYSKNAKLHPYQLANHCTSNALSQICSMAREDISPCTGLYYFLMEHRKFDPSFFPPHDLCLLMANLVNSELDKGMLALLDIRLLPAAILLVGSGWKIALPAGEREYVEIYAKHLPNAHVETMPEELEQGSVIMAGDPRICLERDSKFISFAEKADAGYFLTSWDFLGVKSTEYYRRYWLEKFGLSGVLQVPRLKRQSSAAYPAIVRCREVGSTQVRLAKILDLKSGEKSIDQKKAVALLTEEPDGVNSADVKKDEILKNPSCNLTPAVWLNSSVDANIQTTLRLSDCAQIIRCQLPRTKYTRSHQITHGVQPNGSFIAREVGMAALQPQCSFLLDQGGDQVSVNFKRKDSQYKYLLKANDIIFAFRGTQESLGKVGFVAWEPSVPSITGTAFYIIRSLGLVSPIWLFWYLQSKEARSHILARSSGTTMLNISVEDTKNLLIRAPRADELAEIISWHEAIAVEVKAISDAVHRITTNVENIKIFQA